MPQLVLSTKNLVAQSVGCQIQIGLLSDEGFLTNITSDYGTTLTITVREGQATIFESSGGLYLQATSLKTIVLRLDYSNGTDEVVNYVSLWSFPAPVYPNIYDVATAMQKYLPPMVYNTSPAVGIPYSKNYATGAVFADLWADMLSNFYTIYPPLTSDTSWEKELNDGYPWANSSYYNLVLQLANNLPLYSANLYDTSFLISKYIYARIGEQYFVYIEETAQNLDAWKLGDSMLGIDTYLGADEYPNKVIIHIQTSLLPSDFTTDLNQFIRKILPVDVTFEVSLDPDFSVFGLIIEIPDTYEEDPSLYNKYAIQYNPNTLYDASALITPYNPIFITSYELSPPSGNLATSDPPFFITAQAVYTYNGVDYPLDVTSESLYSTSDASIISLVFNLATINDNGIVTITGTFLDQIAHVTYNVQNDDWVLGDSYLGLDTFLG
jgi:hypothetical protein